VKSYIIHTSWSAGHGAQGTGLRAQGAGLRAQGAGSMAFKGEVSSLLIEKSGDQGKWGQGDARTFFLHVSRSPCLPVSYLVAGVSFGKFVPRPYFPSLVPASHPSSHLAQGKGRRAKRMGRAQCAGFVHSL